jgi:hypothetical protein
LESYQGAGLKASDFLGHVTWLHKDSLRLQNERLASEHATDKQQALDALRSELTGVTSDSAAAAARSNEANPSINGTPGQSGALTLDDYETKIANNDMTPTDWLDYQKSSAAAGFSLTGHW